MAPGPDGCQQWALPSFPAHPWHERRKKKILEPKTTGCDQRGETGKKVMVLVKKADSMAPCARKFNSASSRALASDL